MHEILLLPDRVPEIGSEKRTRSRRLPIRSLQSKFPEADTEDLRSKDALYRKDIVQMQRKEALRELVSSVLIYLDTLPRL